MATPACVIEIFFAIPGARFGYLFLTVALSTSTAITVTSRRYSFWGPNIACFFCVKKSKKTKHRAHISKVTKSTNCFLFLFLFLLLKKQNKKINSHCRRRHLAGNNSTFRDDGQKLLVSAISHSAVFASWFTDGMFQIAALQSLCFLSARDLIYSPGVCGGFPVVFDGLFLGQLKAAMTGYVHARGLYIVQDKVW